MSSYQPFLIAPWDSQGAGLQEYYKPFLIANDAFPILEDAYCWRGSVRKREGYNILATLPTLPVQGLSNYYVPSTGNIQLIAFSKTKAYLFDNTTEAFIDISFFQTSGAAISWTGGNDDFFWTSNFQNSLWVTNNVDNLRFWNGNSTQGWNNQKPIVSGATTLDRCLLVLPYKGRLVVLNTTEGGTLFRQRARWSQIGTAYVPASGGDPVVVPPVPLATDIDAWRSDIPGRGGFTDADTNERIISAGIVRDTMIVFFQRSTWRLRYTGNEILPFIWERLNTQYGSESTFSTIAFDDALLTFSRFGIIAADTNSVRRIDEKIPDFSFDVEAGTTLTDLQRIHGIRDFYRQTAYWAYARINSGTINNKVLNYNYLDRTWAIFNQPFRCYGYYNTFNDLTWAKATFTWQSANEPWQSPFMQSDFPQVVAGAADPTNGDVYIVYDFANEGTDDGTNINFNIWTKKFNPYFKEGKRCKLAYVDIYCTGDFGGEITVSHYIDDEDGFPILTRNVKTSSTNEARYVRIYLGAIARFHQLNFYLSPAQMDDDIKAQALFEIQGIIMWTRPEGRLKTSTALG